jgi:5-formyltetrahydrofolate cyclo-ligase
MSIPLSDAKAVLRAEIRARLKVMTVTERAAGSAQLCARLQGQEVWRAAAAVLFFAPLPDEPDIWPLLETALTSGKTVLLPRFDPATQDYAVCRVQELGETVKMGRFGIREPSEACPVWPLNRLDLGLVPGVGFGWNGRRLGRGKGYYDRLLQSVSGTKCGVAFDEQVVGEIPSGPYDISLDYILTPTRWHRATGPRRF